MVEGQELLEGLALPFADGDEVDELPVVLGGEPDALLVRDTPEGGGIDRPAEMDVELGQLIAERMRQLAALFAGRRPAHPPPAPGRGGATLGVLVPHRLSVIVG